MEEPRVVFGTLLDKLLELMDSEYGFIGEVKHQEDGTPYLQTHAITNIAWDAATQAFYEENVEHGLKFMNLNSLFGHVIVTATPLIANEPNKHPSACGIPDGHPPLNHFLGIPFFEARGTKMNGMVGIANKPGGYSEADIEFLEPFTVTCSNLIQAYNAIRENKYLINTLEEKVADRTKELRLANVSLEEANRRVVKASQDQLQHFACMSHEIRTPLNCIMGLSSLLQDTKLNAYQEDSLKMIVTSGELLLTVVNDVLDYSKLESGNVEIRIQRSNLQETLDAVVHSIDQKAKQKHLQLRTFYDCDVPEFIETDKQRLQQILYNLLGNAVKFSKEGGDLDFSVKLIRPDDNNDCHVQKCPVSHKAKPSGNVSKEPPTISNCPFLGKNDLPLTSSQCPYHSEGVPSPSKRDRTSATPFVRFSVKDYGRGIDKKDFGRIFEPFKQADINTEVIYGGTGLGLAITSKLVKGLKGIISVDSVAGEWSEFTVDIPYNGKSVDKSRISESSKHLAVWMVDDDEGESFVERNVFHTFGLNFTKLKSMEELEECVMQQGASTPGQCVISLVNENLYQPELHTRFSQKVRRSILLTFGPNYTVKETDGHYRSLQQVLPSVLMQSLISQVNSHVIVSRDVKRVSSTEFQPLAHSDIRVLIAEDNAINQKVLVRMLKRLGLVNIDIVDNGHKAVDKAASQVYDIVYMDIQMPIMGGLEACTHVVKNRGNNFLPKVVFVTAHASDDYEVEGIRVGGDGFVSKPYNIAELEKSFDLICPNE
jgi:signal transduction histidine kinase/CheY-like chemotaxis protein